MEAEEEINEASPSKLANVSDLINRFEESRCERVCVCLCVFVHVCVYVCVHVCACMCV